MIKCANKIIIYKTQKEMIEERGFEPSEHLEI
jgi:hypothetical protein